MLRMVARKSNRETASSSPPSRFCRRLPRVVRRWTRRWRRETPRSRFRGRGLVLRRALLLYELETLMRCPSSVTRASRNFLLPNWGAWNSNEPLDEVLAATSSRGLETDDG